MRRAGIVIAAVLIAGWAAAPAAAMPAGRDAKPRVLSAEVAVSGRDVTVTVVGRDRDDVVGGAEISWGAGQPSQGLSACTPTSDGRAGRRVGRRARFNLFYSYPEAGDRTITLRVLSGGCGKRAPQRSAPRTLAVHVD
jgi:hypothetical protein